MLSRLFIPHLSFREDKLPDKIPLDMEDKINELRTNASSPQEFLLLSHDFIGSRYRSQRLFTILKFHYLFKDLEAVWRSSGYMPCTQTNFLLRIFLTRSGFFGEKDVRRRHAMVNLVTHQYLQVRIDNRWIDVDVGEKQRGMPIGKHLRFFG